MSPIFRRILPEKEKGIGGELCRGRGGISGGVLERTPGIVLERRQQPNRGLSELIERGKAEKGIALRSSCGGGNTREINSIWTAVSRR